MVCIKDVLSDYSKALHQAQFNFGDNPLARGGLPFEIARTIISKHEQATDLSCIMHGEDRINGRVLQRRFGPDDESVEAYREYLGEWRES